MGEKSHNRNIFMLLFELIMPIPHGGGDIGVWCNGSTIDFGSISSSSNLDTLTTTNQNNYIMIQKNKIYNGDCLDIMKEIQDKSVDAIICDLPYETTPCKWDKMIPLDKLWAHYKRIIKPNGAIVLFCQQPFTTKLISSNIDMWKYNWIWMKDNGTNFLNSHYQPIKITEDIAVFGFASSSPSSSEHLTYHPQMRVNAGGGV